MIKFDFHEIAFAVPLLAFSLSALVRDRPPSSPSSTRITRTHRFSTPATSTSSASATDSADRAAGGFILS
jgi:hypothetical protein